MGGATTSLEQATPDYRDIERMEDMDTPHSSIPACFAQVFNLPEELEKAVEIRHGEPVQRGQYGRPVLGPIGADIKFVLEYERECEGWTPYRFGFTPKEHQEMLDSQWQRKFNRKTRWIEIGTLIAGAAIAVVAVIAAVLLSNRDVNVTERLIIEVTQIVPTSSEGP